MASGTTKISWGKTSKGFAEYLNVAGQTIGRATAKRLATVAADFLANEDWDWPRGQRFNVGGSMFGSRAYKSGFRGGDAMHPWYTGNLHDSMAVGVMQGSRIMASSFMTPGATVLQSHEGRTVDGVTAGMNALQRAAHTFAPGSSGETLRTVLVIGVPYAEKVNQMPGHEGYWDYFEREFVSSLAPAIEHLRKVKLRLK